MDNVVIVNLICRKYIWVRSDFVDGVDDLHVRLISLIYSDSLDVGFVDWTHFVAAIMRGFAVRLMAIMFATDTGAVVPV